MEDLNQALTAKRGWEMMAKPNCLWVQALTAKYCRGSALLQVGVHQRASWFWQGLLQTRDIVAAGFCWAVKAGSSLNIWSSPWVPGIEGFQPKLKWGTLLDRNLNLVRDLIEPNSNSWKSSLIMSILEDQSARAILDIPLAPPHSPDLPRWILSGKEVFTVKEAYLTDQALFSGYRRSLSAGMAQNLEIKGSTQAAFLIVEGG